MRLGKFTHANLNTPVYGDLDMISFWYHSESAKGTLLVAPGAVLPVKESVDEVTKLKEGKTNESVRKQKRTA